MNYTPSREDYLVTIYLLQQTTPLVRSIDVAKTLNLSKPSVSQSLRLLQENGLVSFAEDHTLLLTPQGTRQAQDIYDRYQTTVDFLTHILHVSPATACEDARRMEHYLSKETHQKMKTLLAQKTSAPLTNPPASTKENPQS